VSSSNIDWFFRWPDDALQKVAEKYLEGIDFKNKEGVDLTQSITAHFVFAHSNMPNVSSAYELETKRKIYVTPKNYLDFLLNYTELVSKMKQESKILQDKYALGLVKIEESNK
jgi:dynein heavy chain, axonemal